MASTLVRETFHRPGWVYEEKYDGWRMLAFKDGSRARLISRQGVDHTARFRELAAAVSQLRAPELVLDGEVCVFDEDLVSQFHLLGRPDPAVIATPPVLMAFDCLRVLGVDVRGLPRRRYSKNNARTSIQFGTPSRYFRPAAFILSRSRWQIRTSSLLSTLKVALLVPVVKSCVTCHPAFTIWTWLIMLRKPMMKS